MQGERGLTMTGFNLDYRLIRFIGLIEFQFSLFRNRSTCVHYYFSCFRKYLDLMLDTVFLE